MSETRWPQKGDKLRFLGKNGYDHQLTVALDVLTPGEAYVCVDCHVGDWDNSVSLEEVPGRFNGVMFDFADEAEAEQ